MSEEASTSAEQPPAPVPDVGHGAENGETDEKDAEDGKAAASSSSGVEKAEPIDPAEPPREAAFASDWLQLAMARLGEGQNEVAAAAARVAAELDQGLKKEVEALLEQAEGKFRRVELGEGRELYLELAPNAEEQGRDPGGGPIWKAGEALARLINEKTPDMKGLRVLELGSGEGIAGLGIALCGCEAVLTDLPDALPLLARNVERNRPKVLAAGGKVRSKALDWRVKPGYEGAAQKCDFVLVADVVWSEDHCMPLVIWLAGYGKPVLLALSKRPNHEAMMAKLQMMWKVTGLVGRPIDVGDATVDAYLILSAMGGASMEGLDFRSSQLWRSMKKLVGD